MQLLSAEYNSFKTTPERIDLWAESLSGIPENAIYSACMALVHDESPYPPNIGKVKRRALLFANGSTTELTGIEAWGHVLKKLRDSSFQLTSLEKKALANVCDFYSLKQKADTSFDRSLFIKSFDIELQKEITQLVIPSAILKQIDTKREEAQPAKQLQGEVITTPHDQPLTGFEGMTEKEKADDIAAMIEGVGK